MTDLLACAVCFRGAEADPLVRDGLNAGIWVLLGVTGTVLAVLALFVVRLARRARAVQSGDADAPHGLALPDGAQAGRSTP